jgi:hypothetical protein
MTSAALRLVHPHIFAVFYLKQLFQTTLRMLVQDDRVICLEPAQQPLAASIHVQLSNVRHKLHQSQFPQNHLSFLAALRDAIRQIAVLPISVSQLSLVEVVQDRNLV